MQTNMYGCDVYGYDDEGTGMARPCTHPRALGWVAALFFLLLVIVGGLVIPTVLIGIISVAFNEAAEAVRLEKKLRVRPPPLLLLLLLLLRAMIHRQPLSTR